VTYRRPSLRTLVFAAVIASAASLLLAFSRPIDMIVDGQPVVSDVPPVTTTTDVYVPLRTLGDALGATVRIDGSNMELDRGAQSLRVKVGSTLASIDGQSFTLRRAPFRVRGRVMISLRPIARAFGVHASFDARTAQIQIMTAGVGEAIPGAPPQAQ
jgi:hypothetical protein